MKTSSMVIIALVILGLFFLISGCGAYNSLVNNEQQVQQNWSEVESQYQRRSDLIPNLVATVKAYARHEQEVFTGVAEARARATQITLGKDVVDDPESLRKFVQAQEELKGALGRLLAITESYPDLRSNENFIALQTQLEGTENRITVARGRFNAAVRSYNTSVRQFPANIFAGIFGFQQHPYFELTPGSERVPKVEL